MARSFNGTTDFITIPTSFSIPSSGNPFSVSAWFFTAATGVAEAIISSKSGNGLVIQKRADDLLEADSVGLILLSSATVSFNVWQNVVFTYDGSSSAKFYLNGSDITSGVFASRTLASDQYDIGFREQFSDLFWSGNLAQLGVWNIVLSASDALALFTTGPLAVQPANLIGYWPLYGDRSPEPDLSNPGGNDAGLTGTSFANDGPVSGPHGSILRTTLTGVPAKAFTKKHYYNEIEKIRGDALAAKEILDAMDDRGRADHDFELAQAIADNFDKNMTPSNYAKAMDARENLEKARKARDHHYFMDVVKRAWDDHNKK